MIQEGAAVGGGGVGVGAGLLMLQTAHNMRLVPSKDSEGSEGGGHQDDASHQKSSPAQPVHQAERDNGGPHFDGAQPYCGKGSQGGATEAYSLKDISGVVKDVWLAGELLKQDEAKADEESSSHVVLRPKEG